MMESEIPEIDEGKLDLSTIPLKQRIENKDWKYRASAIDEIKTNFLNLDEETLLYIETILPKLTSDSNASVLENAFEISILYLDSKPDLVKQETLEKILTNILEKGISARPSTQSKCKSLLFMMVEITEPKWLVLLLLPKLGDKKPKIPPFILDFLVESISSFGANFFPIKDILVALPPLFNTTNNLTRDAAMNLLTEIYKWVGEGPLFNILENLRPAQKSDFEKIKSELPQLRPQPSRKIRKFADIEIENPSSTVINTKDLIDEVDLSKKLKGSDYLDLMKSEKWSEQFQGLEIIEKVIGPTPKIKYSPLAHDLISSIHELLKTGHLQVQLKCLKLLSMFSEGLGSKISADIRNLMVTIISKLKEKKLVQDVENCFKSFLTNSLSFDSLSDEIVENLKNKKSPAHSKICLNQVFAFYLESKKVIYNFDLFKNIFETLVVNCDDPDPKVRESSAISLNLLFNKYGDEANFKKLFSNLNSSNSKLFKRITANLNTKSDEILPESKNLDTTQRNLKLKEPINLSSKAALATENTIVKPLKQSEDTNKTKKQATKSKEEDNQEVSEDITISSEDLTQILQTIDLIEGDPTHQLLLSSKWQEKVDGLSKIKDTIASLKVGGRVLHALFLYLKQLTTNFKISNVNVTKALVEVFISAAENVGEIPINKNAIAAIISVLSEKISDKKLQSSIEILFKQFCLLGESSLTFRKIISVIEPSKSPIVHQILLQWMKSYIDEFKLSGIPLSIVSSFAVREIENKNVSVRNAAVELIGSIYNKLGPPLLSIIFTKDLSPHSKALMEAEINKVGFDSKAISNTRLDSEDSLPRREILDLVDKNIFSNLSSVDGKDSWQIRKSALENILNGCESCGHYLEYSKSFLELAKAVKLRLNDTQSNLKPLAINVLGNLFSSLSNDKAVKGLKMFGASILQGLADNKKPMRDSTISTLDKIITLNTEKVDHAIYMCIVLLSSEVLENVNARPDIISWFLNHQDCFEGDCGDLASNFISVLQDKNAIVRNNTEQLLIYLFSNNHLSKVSLEKAIRDLSPAIKRSLQFSIDKILVSNISKDQNEPKQFPKQELNNIKIDNNINKVHTPIIADMTNFQNSFVLSETISSKKQRLSEWSNWPKPPMEPSIYDLSVLKSQWKTFMVDEFFDDFFSENLELIQSSLQKIKSLFNTPIPLLHSDYILRYISYLFVTRRIPSFYTVLLEFLKDFFRYVINNVNNHSEIIFEIGELNLFLPHLIKIFPDFQPYHIETFQQILEYIYSLIPMNKVSSFLMIGIQNNSPLSSKIFYLHEIFKVLESVGFGALTRSDLNELVKFLFANHESIKESGILFLFSKTLTNLVDRDFTKLNSFFEAENIDKVFYLLGKPKSLIPINNYETQSNLDINSILSDEIRYIIEYLSDCSSNQRLTLSIAHKLRSIFDVFTSMDWPLDSIKLIYELVSKVIQFLNKGLNANVVSATNYTCCSLVIALLVHIFSLPNAKSLVTIQSQTDLLTGLLNFLQNNQLSNSNDSFERLLKRSFNLLLHDFINLYEPGETILMLLDTLFQTENSSKIQIRLILTIINNESKKINPFTDGNWNLAKIFSSFDSYFNSGRHNNNTYRLIKTITQSILRGVGYQKVIEILNSFNLPDQSLIYSIVSLLNDNISNNSNLEAKIVTAINDITFARDKLNSIRELYKLKQQYSELDLNLYLKKLSPVFRRFVFDILAKIEDKERSKEKELSTNTLSNNEFVSASNPHEAILLIESLKTKPPQYRTSMKLERDINLDSEETDSFGDKKLYGSPRSVPISPFTRRNEKIRDSLSSLTKSLQLPTINDETKASDSLENRLQRLKSLQNMSNLDI